MAFKFATATADAMLAAIGTRCNTGYIRLYSGTEPATANTTLSGNTLLAELRFGATAFNATIAASGSDRVMTANAITQDDLADADGTATFFRAFTSGGTAGDVVFQGTVGTSGQQLNLGATNIVSGGVVRVDSMTITQPTV